MSNSLLDRAYLHLSGDARVNVWHISIYMALLHKWQQNGFQSPVQITRREVMQLAHVRSIATYHKIISELQTFGYIHYAPSYNPLKGSRVFITKSK